MTRFAGWVFIVTSYVVFISCFESGGVDMVSIIYCGAVLIAGAILARG